MGTDPISELITVLAEQHPAKATVPAGQAGGNGDGGQLAKAAVLIPGRTETSVEDLLDSPELSRFRMHFAAGKVEAELIGQALSLLKAFLSARGLI